MRLVQIVDTVQRNKLDIALRSHRLLTQKYGVPEEDLYFDCLVFPVATGDGKYIGSAAETMAAIRLGGGVLQSGRKRATAPQESPLPTHGSRKRLPTWRPLSRTAALAGNG